LRLGLISIGEQEREFPLKSVEKAQMQQAEIGRRDSERLKETQVHGRDESRLEEPTDNANDA